MDEEHSIRKQSSEMDEENEEERSRQIVSPSFAGQEEPRVGASQTIEPILQRIDQTTRRLVVHSICLENFKSYQGVQTIGPFDDVTLM